MQTLCIVNCFIICVILIHQIKRITKSFSKGQDRFSFHILGSAKENSKITSTLIISYNLICLADEMPVKYLFMHWN